ncbi:MAG TPA: polymer-forming cytoskeletal protein [Geobacterales bacterium]|nr:polymer-forming cytoskeletal protein [Geobacterales bacterium]
MFSSNKKDSRLETSIGPETTLKGELVSTGTVRVDGTFEGNITADWVIIGERGSVQGDVAAKVMIIGGKIRGNLRAANMVEIKPKGEVTGEIVTARLTVHEGAVFDGRSTMQRLNKELEYRSVQADLVE